MRRRCARWGRAPAAWSSADRLENAVAVAIERVKPGRELPPNVEIMAALLLDAVERSGDAFTLVFAVGRSAGWLAHAMETEEAGRSSTVRRMSDRRLVRRETITTRAAERR